MLPFDTIKASGVIPIRTMHGSLVVAMMNPVNKAFFEDFKTRNPGLSVQVQFISEADFQRMVGKLAIAYSSAIGPDQKQETATPQGESSLSVGLTALLIRNRPFAHLSEATLARALPLFTLRQTGPDSTLYSPGEESREFFLIKSGQVAMTRVSETGAVQHIVTLCPGDSFAELSLLSGSRHSLRASSVSASQLYVISADGFARLLADPEFSIAISTRLAVRLQEINRDRGVRFNPDRVFQLVQLVNVLRRDLIDQCRVVPLAMDAAGVVIGAVNLDDPSVYTSIARALPGHRISFAPLTEDEFELCHKALFAAPAPTAAGASASNNANLDPKVQLDLLISLARETACSEVRLEPFGQQYRFRFRIQGSWHEKHERVSHDVGLKLVARARALSQPNRGELRSEFNKVQVLTQTCFCPIKGGDVLTLRIAGETGSSSAGVPFQLLVPERNTYSRIRDTLRARCGVLVFSGPGLSGKTTSIRAVTDQLTAEGRTVVAIDPSFLGTPGIRRSKIRFIGNGPLSNGSFAQARCVGFS